MSKLLESRVARALGFVVAVVIPLIGVLLASRRQIQVALAFLVHEITGAGGLLLLLMLAPIVVIAILYSLRRVRYSARFGIVGSAIISRYRFLIVPLVLASLVVTALHVRTRYRLFSEVSFQESALSAVEAGRFGSATAICRRYVSLYPHRAAAGSFPDPVCSPILQFSANMSSLSDYIERQSAAAVRTDQMVITPEEDAKARTVQILRQWAGR